MSAELIEQALIAARDFASDEVENRSCAGGSMSDYINEAQEVVDACEAALAALQGDADVSR